jgi:outer membrane protein assembly factor BamB
MLLVWMRESLFAVSPGTGEISFEFPWRARILESVNASMPVVHDETVLITECYGKGSAMLDTRNLETVDGKLTPKLLWSDASKRDKALEAHWNTPIVIGDSVFGCSGRHSAPAELRCVDWKTGEVRWKKKGLSRSSVTYVDGHFIVLGEQGQLLLIEATADKFNLVTEYEPSVGNNAVKFKSPCWAAPIISHGLLYVRGKDQLVCFELIPESM